MHLLYCVLHFYLVFLAKWLNNLNIAQLFSLCIPGKGNITRVTNWLKSMLDDFGEITNVHEVLLEFNQACYCMSNSIDELWYL